MRITRIFAMTLLATAGMTGCEVRKDLPHLTQTSALTKALLAWTAKGGDLDKALPSHGDENVKTEDEADAVCAALRAFRARAQTSVKPPLTSPLHTLTALFQQVEDERAFARLKQAGLPQLRLCVEDALHGKGGREEDILFILKILAMYQEEQDVFSAFLKLPGSARQK